MFHKSFHRIHLNTRDAERKGPLLWTFVSNFAREDWRMLSSVSS
jgi:hypothetical protein